MASIPIPGGQVQIFAGADVDLEEATARVAQRRDKLRSEIERAERKLANEGFVAKARAGGGPGRAREAGAPAGGAGGAVRAEGVEVL